MTNSKHFFFFFCSETHQSTLQASFLSKKIFVNNVSVTLNIWDTAGQERFHALGPLYYRDSNGALLVYDVTDPDSLNKVKVWVKELRKMLGNNVSLSIVGNKIDLLTGVEKIQMSNDLIAEAKDYANTAGALHHCTSAKTNQGIDELFLDLTKRKPFCFQFHFSLIVYCWQKWFHSVRLSN